jgi:hypothetical protein
MKSRILTIVFILVAFSVQYYAQSELKVTEIMFDVPSSTAGDANGDGTRSSRWDEFVELYNAGTEVIDLSAYQLVEREGVAFFTFPLNTTLAPGQFAVVFGGGIIDSFKNIPSGTLLFSNELVNSNSGFSNGLGKSNLSNTSDRVMLVNPLLADTLFELYWGGDTTTGAQPIKPFTKQAIYMGPPNTISGDTIVGAIGQSITRDINGTKWDMHTIVVSDPQMLFSPGKNAAEAKLQANIVMTEIMFDVPSNLAGDANGDGVRGAKSDEFVEIYNKGPIDADLSGFQILDREGVVLYTFPNSTILSVGQFAIVFGAVGSAGFYGIPKEALVFAVHESDSDVGFDNGMGKTNFSNAGDAVLLVNSIIADTLAEVYWGTATPQTSKAIYLGSPNTITGNTISGSIRQSVTHKINNDLWDMHTIVSGDTNSLFSPGLDAPKSPFVHQGDLIFTEIMFDPPAAPLGDANGDGTRDAYGDEFVELYNRGINSKDLSGYQLLETNGRPIFTFPAGATLNSGHYAVVFGNIRQTGLGSSLPSDAVYFSVAQADSNKGFDNGIGKSNLSQSADAVILVNPAVSDTIVEIYWGSTLPRTSKSIYLGFPNTLSGTTISGSIDQSVTRLISSDKWDTHTYVTNDPNSLFSPGQSPLILGIEREETIPQSYELSQNFPNPFNPATTISFSLPKNERVTLKIYDAIGREVATLINSDLSSGIYKYHWDANSMASGIYFYRITAGNFSKAKKMMLLK